MKRLLWLFSIALVSGYAQSRTGDYAVILSGPPLADSVSSRSLLRTRTAQSRLQRIDAAQQRLRHELKRRNIRVTGSARTLLNAVFVEGSREEIEQLRGLPGVTRVVFLPPVHHHMDRAVQVIRAPIAWDTVGGPSNAGAGVKIAIIDSGLDNKHAAFQDPSLPAPPDPPQVPDRFRPYTNNKIIMARSYTDQLSAPDDITPRDTAGWGTAMAAIAAGVTNTGPATTFSGVAPKAWLGNYKIFDSAGTTRAGMIINALEDALSDRMDIAVLGFGSLAVYPPMAQDPSCAGSDPFPLGIPSDSCDVRAQALERAVRMGMTVVISAGNDGYIGDVTPTLNTINTPGTAPSAITVGASLNAFSSVRVSGDDVPSGIQQIVALFGDGPKPTSPVTAPLRDIARLANANRGCSPLPGGSLSGAIALVQREDAGSTCYFSDKVTNAQNAGAAGVIVYQRNNLNGLFNPLGLADTRIPTVLIGYTAGIGLRNFIGSHTDYPVTIDPAIPSVDGALDSIFEDSSRGPSIGDSASNPAVVQPAIKPEVVAPGSDLYTATQSVNDYGELWDPSGYTYVYGTSFAAPLVGGVAALVKQKNPGFTPAQIKSAIVNTAAPEVSDENGPARVTSVGAGKVNAAAAIAVKATADPATLSFGVIGDADLPVSLTLRVTNSGADAATFDIGVAPRDADENAQVSVTPNSLQLNPGDSGTVAVQLMGGRPAPGSYEGVITVQGGGTNLRIPYLYLATDNQPYSIYPLASFDYDGTGRQWVVLFKLTDRFGIPLWHVPVTWGGDRTPDTADGETDRTGIAGAVYTVGTAANQTFTATAGGLTVSFGIVLQ